MTALHDAFDDGRRRFAGALQALADPRVFADHLRPARQTEWVVYAKRPFAGPQQVLDYVGRYTHRVAIANQRLLDIDDGQVRFRYTDYRADPAQTRKTMTLDAPEFIRRFLLHVLPRGFHRIRYYGWLGHRHRTETLTRCRHLLGTTAAPPIAAAPRPPADYRDRYESLTGVSLRRCPVCADGHMIVTASLLRGGELGAARYLMTRTCTPRPVGIASRPSREGTRVASAHRTRPNDRAGRGHRPRRTRPPRHPPRFKPHSAAPSQRFRPTRFSSTGAAVHRSSRPNTVPPRRQTKNALRSQTQR